MPDKPVLKKQVSRPMEIAATSPPLTVPSPKPAALDATTNPRDLDRSRAKKAWESVQSVKGKDYEGKYSSRVRDLPTMIQVNGLAQTLAFLKAKGKENDLKNRKEDFVQAFHHLSSWVCSCLAWGEGDLLNRVLTTENTQRYRQATSEALALLQWLKRFAEAELKSEEDSK